MFTLFDQFCLILLISNFNFEGSESESGSTIESTITRNEQTTESIEAIVEPTVEPLTENNNDVVSVTPDDETDASAIDNVKPDLDKKNE